MKSYINKLITLLGLSLTVLALNAQNVYIKAGSTGNGSDWNSAIGTLPATLIRGATYYIAGGTYSGYSFSTTNSGATLITIKKATILDHGTSVGWVDSNASQALFGNIGFYTDNYVFDGVTGGGPNQWESNLGFKIKSGGQNIFLSGTRQNIKILHTDVENMGRSTGLDGQNSFYAIGGSSNILISYCYFHDVSICFMFTRNSSSITLDHSKFARNGQGGWIDGLHREPWTLTTDSDSTIRYCIFEDVSNTAVVGAVNGTGTANNWKIYGNVFWWTGKYPDAQVSALIDIRNDTALGVSPSIINMSASNWEFYNNTIVGALGGSSIGSRIGAGTNNKFYNNIWYTNVANEISSWNAAFDYNYYYGNIRTSGCTPPCNKDIKVGTNDVIGTEDPFIDWKNGDFRLKKSIGTGIATAYTLDALGNVRGSDGNWDIGAYEFTKTTVTTNPPATVTNSAPIVTLVSPSNGSVFTNGSNILLSANASDSDGTIASVEFYNSASRLGVKTNPPYSLTWSSVSQGNYSIFAKAYDNKGTSTVSSANSIIVSNSIPLISNGCTNYFTNTIFIDKWFTNTISKTNFINNYYTNTVVQIVTNTITNTVTNTVTNTIVNNITNSVIPDIYSISSVLNKTNKTLDIKVDFQ